MLIFLATDAAAVIVLLLAVAWRDVATRTIPDQLSILIAVLGLAARGMDGWSSLLISIGVAVAVFAVLLVAHGFRMLGGGDVKLMTAVTCGLSPGQVPHFIVVTALAGGVLAICYLILQRALKGLAPRRPPARGSRLLWRALLAERWRIARRGPLPYGVAIASGGIVVIGGRLMG